MFHLEPAVGPDPLVLEGIHAGPCLVLVCVNDQADAAAESGGGAHFQAALDRGNVQLKGARCEIKKQGAR